MCLDDLNRHNKRVLKQIFIRRAVEDMQRAILRAGGEQGVGAVEHRGTNGGLVVPGMTRGKRRGEATENEC